MGKNMKKRFLGLLISCCFASVLVASPVYKMGSYNIRGKNDSDTGDKSWDVRNGYVVKNIVDHDFDVIGLQENSTDMLPDLEKLLGDAYANHSWGAGSASDNRSGTHTTVVYKADKFTLLDKGQFFLAEDPTAPGLPFDTAVRRITVWVKLQNKETGEIFFYFSTHLDHKGEFARAETARLNVRKMQEIAGDYPAFIVGDFNAYYDEKAMYNTFNAYFNDSRKTTQSAPVGPGATFGPWDPTLSGGEPIDYVFCNRVNVLSYETITEDFGRGVTPSDHLPILITCTLQEGAEAGKWYVSASASGAGDGSKEAPFASLQEALDAASKQDTIYMTEGTFYPVESGSLTGRQATMNVSTGVYIRGGYNADFSAVVGKTVLSGDLGRNDVIGPDGRIVSGAGDNACHVVTVADSCFLDLGGLEITGGYADLSGANSGGAIYSKGIDLVLRDVDITDNYAAGYGGGIYTEGNLTAERTTFARNQSGMQGGAFYSQTPGWRTDIDDSYFVDNQATQGSAAYSAGLVLAMLRGNTIAGNVSARNGVYTQTGTSIYTRSTWVNNTFVNNRLTATSNALSDKSNGGAAIYFNAASGALNLVNNTITGNTDSCYTSSGTPSANFNGSAVHVMAGSVKLVNNIIAGNFSSAAEAGEVYLGTSAKLMTSTYNLYGAADRMNITAKTRDMVCYSYDRSVQDLNGMLHSEVVDGKLCPILTDNGGHAPTVRVLSVACGNNNLNVLKAASLRESSFYIDIDGNGKYTDQLTVDGRGVERNTSGSMVGAYEYTGESGIEAASSDSGLDLYVSENRLYVLSENSSASYAIYTASGSLQIEGEAVPGTPVDLSSLPAGVYVVYVHDRAGQVKVIKVLINE
ncbi:hypothetical protein B5F38_08065 [Barnesiella sp. An22]|nr:hypothetical protein B5F38_08065 [Barnesiella sp. An22]